MKKLATNKFPWTNLTTLIGALIKVVDSAIAIVTLGFVDSRYYSDYDSWLYYARLETKPTLNSTIGFGWNESDEPDCEDEP